MVLESEKQPIYTMKDWQHPLMRAKSLAKGLGASMKGLSILTGHSYSSLMGWKRKDPQLGAIARFSDKLSEAGLKNEPVLLWHTSDPFFKDAGHSDNGAGMFYDTINYTFRALPLDRLVSNIELLTMSEAEDLNSLPNDLRHIILHNIYNYKEGRSLPRLSNFRRIMNSAGIGYALIVPTQHYSPSEIMGASESEIIGSYTQAA